MKILFKVNSNPLYQDSLIGAIEHLKKDNHVALYDDSQSFFEIYDRFKPDLIAIDSNRINGSEKKFLSENKVDVIDWNQISRKNIFINKTLFYPTEASSLYETENLGYIKYPKEKEIIKKFTDVRLLSQTKIFSKDFIRSHVYVGWIPYTNLNLAINSCKYVIATNTILYNLATYLNKPVLILESIVGEQVHMNSEFNPEKSLEIITNAQKYQLAS